MSIERLKELMGTFGTHGLSMAESEEVLLQVPKLLAFVESYDHWLKLFEQDAREDLEDDGSLELSVQKLDEARKALDG